MWRGSHSVGKFVAGDPARFERLLSEQLTPDVLEAQVDADLAATVAGYGPGPAD